MSLDVGDPAPDFTLPTDGGGTISLRDLRGRPVVVYFYPKDDTPGCTAQACGLRDAWSEVAASGIEVFGVSPDSVASHVRFREKHNLPYRLLSDDGHRVAEAFGVWVEKTFAGKTYFGNERTTFVVGADGRIERVLPQVKPDEHAALLLEALAA